MLRTVQFVNGILGHQTNGLLAPRPDVRSMNVGLSLKLDFKFQTVQSTNETTQVNSKIRDTVFNKCYAKITALVI